MIAWAYVSRCLVPEQQHVAALQDIVAAARPKNELLKVTGCLVFTGMRFAQFIEGPHSNIVELQKSIRADQRHTDVITVEEEQVKRRRFRFWSLAYAGPSISVSRIIGETLRKVDAGNNLDTQNWGQLLKQFTSSTRH